MRKYIIERDVPGFGNSSAEQLGGAAAQSNRALAEVGPGIQWLESFVTKDKIFCVYLADSEQLIRKHAECSGFPANRILEVKAMLDASCG